MLTETRTSSQKQGTPAACSCTVQATQSPRPVAALHQSCSSSSLLQPSAVPPAAGSHRGSAAVQLTVLESAAVTSSWPQRELSSSRPQQQGLPDHLSCLAVTELWQPHRNALRHTSPRQLGLHCFRETKNAPLSCPRRDKKLSKHKAEVAETFANEGYGGGGEQK